MGRLSERLACPAHVPSQLNARKIFMSAKLTGHVVIEVDGEEQHIEASSFTEEHDGLWKYYGDGYSLQVTANLEGAVDAAGNYPTFLNDPEIDDNVVIAVIDARSEERRVGKE